MVKIRPYQPGDAARISDLLARETPYRRDEAFWLWINRQWPEEPSLVVVAELDGVIVGHYAILPFPLRCGGRRVSAGLGVHALIAESARKKVSIFHLSRKCYQLAEAAGLEIVWGFPNERYRLIQEKVEKWREVRTFAAHEKRPSDRYEDHGYRFAPMDLSAPADRLRLNDLLESAAPAELCTAPVGFDLWSRRYHAHPQNSYSFHVLERDGEPLGAVVTKTFESSDPDRRLGHLVDYSLHPDASPDGLLQGLEGFFGDTVDALSVWPSTVRLGDALDRAGYRATGFETYFGIKFLNAAAEAELDPLLDWRNWKLTMGMSDVF